jgi:hypothetical protein
MSNRRRASSTPTATTGWWIPDAPLMLFASLGSASAAFRRFVQKELCALVLTIEKFLLLNPQL